jgi:hypothetical protein
MAINRCCFTKNCSTVWYITLYLSILLHCYTLHKWDVPHSETVFGKATPDDGHIRPKHVVKVRGGRKLISCIVEGSVVCEKYINATECLNIISFQLV